MGSVGTNGDRVTCAIGTCTEISSYLKAKVCLRKMPTKKVDLLDPAMPAAMTSGLFSHINQ